MTIAGRIRGALAAKLLLITAGVSIVLGLLISGVEIWQESRASIGNEQRESHAAVMANVDTIALAVWTLDDSVLNLAASSLIRGTSIIHVEVVEDGKARLTFNRPGPPVAAEYSWDVPILRPNSDQQIGTLRLSESYADVRAELVQRAAVLIVTELMKIFATSILVFSVAYLLVTRPLRQLARQVESGSEQEAASPIAIPRPLDWGRDEIDALIDAINVNSVMRRRMEAEQRRHQSREANAGKLEALGQLAGGIAHDFNNILGAILGFAGLLKDDVADRPEQRRFVHRIITACERGRELIGQIRAFAREEGTERKTFDLIRIVRQNTNLLTASLPKITRLRLDYPSGELRVYGNEALLGQIVTNLCMNASEALDGTPGEVQISVGHATPAELNALRTGSAVAPGERLVGEIGASNGYACLRVGDTAGGISEAVLDRIFEPFFTTKGRQRGTGLGLAVVHGVIESHGGACHVVSRAGAGTTFSVYLPLCETPVTEPIRARSTHAISGRERILVVDDEPDLVDMLTIGLERLGYEAVGVTDPMEAIAAFEEDPAAWDTVITDEVMPGMRGLELIRRLKAIRPDMKFVLCTGYSDSTTDEIMHKAGVDVFLLKPVDATTVAARLRQLMDVPAK